MNAIETAIRNALAKSDRANPDMRARIYRSARQAVDAGLARQNITDPQIVAAQHDALERLIAQIEDEESGVMGGRADAPAAATPVSAAGGRLDLSAQSANEPVAGPRAPTPSLDAPSLDAPPRGEPSSRAAPPLDAPSLDAEPMPSSGGDLGALGAERLDAPSRAQPGPQGRGRSQPPADPVLAAPVAAPEPRGRASADKRALNERALNERAWDERAGGDAGKAPKAGRKRRRGAGLLASLLIYGLILAALGGGGWWFLRSGLMDQMQALLDGNTASRPAPPPTDGSQFRGLRTLDPKSGFGDDWIAIMTAGEGGKVTDAGVDTVSTGDGPAVRITARPGGDARIAVPASVLQQLSGKSSTVALTVQSSTGKPMDIALECDFGALGGCGRHRFAIGHDKTDILLQVVFDRGATPQTPGNLLIDTDLSGKGGGINLFAVRVLPGQ